MKDQRRGGHIFNMDGAGADGNATPRYLKFFAAIGNEHLLLIHLLGTDSGSFFF